MSTLLDGTRLVGSRVTVFDVYYYLENGRAEAEIADILRIPLAHVRDAVRYIDDHREEVSTVHEQIERRNARGNPPEIEAKLEQARKKLRDWIQKHHGQRQESSSEGADRGC
jgi:uncharacterized protein (DUF433 family)